MPDPRTDLQDEVNSIGPPWWAVLSAERHTKAICIVTVPSPSEGTWDYLHCPQVVLMLDRRHAHDLMQALQQQLVEPDRTRFGRVWIGDVEWAK